MTGLFGCILHFYYLGYGSRHKGGCLAKAGSGLRLTGSLLIWADVIMSTSSHFWPWTTLGLIVYCLFLAQDHDLRSTCWLVWFLQVLLESLDWTAGDHQDAGVGLGDSGWFGPSNVG